MAKRWEQRCETTVLTAGREGVGGTLEVSYLGRGHRGWERGGAGEEGCAEGNEESPSQAGSAPGGGSYWPRPGAYVSRMEKSPGWLALLSRGS